MELAFELLVCEIEKHMTPKVCSITKSARCIPGFLEDLQNVEARKEERNKEVKFLFHVMWSCSIIPLNKIQRNNL